MRATNGHGAHASVTAAQPVALVRYRPGLAGEAARTVHFIPLPAGQVGAATALCGALLRPEEIDIVTPGEGMPCTLCTVNHITASVPPADAAGASTNPTVADYRAWGWPVTQHHHQG